MAVGGSLFGFGGCCAGTAGALAGTDDLDLGLGLTSLERVLPLGI